MKRTIYDADHESFRSSIRAGCNEIMKELIGRDLGL